MKIIGKLMNWMLLSCEEATLLITKKEYEKLTFIQAVHLRLHLLSCHLCRRYEMQNKSIQAFWTEMEAENRVLSPTKKKELHKIVDHVHE